MKNKEFTKKEMLEYNKLYEANSKKSSDLLSINRYTDELDKEVYKQYQKLINLNN